ncbi:MAG: hypothetical protein JXR10_18025 [Cyclobacteriaceae bacterium]
MSAEIFIILMLLFMLVVISTPTLISLLIRKWLTKKGHPKIGNIVTVAVVAGTLYLVYIAIFPPTSFYEDEFEQNTGLELPNSAKFLAKNASYPDLHGDYWSAAIVELSNEDYDQLRTQLFETPKMKLDTSKYGIGITTDFDELTSKIDLNSIEVTLESTRNEWFKIALLTDGRTIIFERSSS